MQDLIGHYQKEIHTFAKSEKFIYQSGNWYIAVNTLLESEELFQINFNKKTKSLNICIERYEKL